MDTDFDRYQAFLQQKKWTWDDVPFYKKGEKLDITPWHDLDYMDVYEKVYGRKMGCNGIGKLREVALTKISEAENQLYDSRFPYVNDMTFLEGHGLGQIPDIALCQRQQEHYAKTLEDNGVRVHWIDWGEYPVSAFGPMQAMWAPQELFIINGGAVVPKLGWHPFSFGRTEFLSEWAFWKLNIPTLLTITGTGVCEVGATMWFAQDVYVVGLSPAYNQEGLDQLLPVVRRTAQVDDLKVLTVRCQTDRYFDKRTGATAHVTNPHRPARYRQGGASSAGRGHGVAAVAPAQWLSDRRVRPRRTDPFQRRRRVQRQDSRTRPRGDGRRSQGDHQARARRRRRGDRSPVFRLPARRRRVSLFDDGDLSRTRAVAVRLSVALTPASAARAHSGIGVANPRERG